MKSRGVYETLGGTVLLAAHRAIESITLDRAAHLKDEIMPRYAELIYNGFWFSPEREMLQALIDKQPGERHRHGAAEAVQGLGPGGRPEVAAHALQQAFATFEKDTVYDQRDAAGFIRLNAAPADRRPGPGDGRGALRAPAG